MKIRLKSIVALCLVCNLLSTTCVQGDLFNFSKKSLLDERQQEEVRAFFLEVMLDASKVFVTYLQDPVVYKKIKSSIDNPSTLKIILMERFFKYSRKSEDKKLVEKFVRFTKDEENFLTIMQDDNDGLFNGIIRETVRRFAKNHLNRTNDKKAIVQEIFKVLWNGITNKELICSIDINFVDALKERIGGQLSSDVISSVYRVFHDVPGDFCNKVATIVANVLCTEFNDVVEENCCCSCLKSTLGITKKVVRKIIPILPALLQIALLIAKEAI